MINALDRHRKRGFRLYFICAFSLTLVASLFAHVILPWLRPLGALLTAWPGMQFLAFPLLVSILLIVGGILIYGVRGLWLLSLIPVAATALWLFVGSLLLFGEEVDAPITPTSSPTTH
jgi:hypothetical protein